MFNLMPEPKKISYGANKISLKSFSKARISAGNDYSIAALKNRFCDLEISEEADGLFFEMSNGWWGHSYEI